MSIHDSIRSLPRTSKITIKKLQNQNINTLWDLVNVIPLRYKDYRKVVSIGYLKSKYNSLPFLNVKTDNADKALKNITIEGQVVRVVNERTRKFTTIQKAYIFDGKDQLEAVWFRQPYIAKILRSKMSVRISGEAKVYLGKVIMHADEYEIINHNSLLTNIHTGRLVPVYSEKTRISSKTLREKIFYILNSEDYKIKEILPEKIVDKFSLLDENQAYKQIHFPDNLTKSISARKRLAFDEVFILQLSSRIIKQKWEKEKVGHRFNIAKHKSALQGFQSTFGFTLTNAQKRSVSELLADLEKNTPMNRLLQGDVGSGKTVVAAIGCFLAYLNGFQSLLMAPTEILSKQHFKTLTKLFSHPTLNSSPHISLVTSSSKPGRGELDRANIIVGTHALLSKKINFNNIGFVVVDEQHKFGVVQRAKLKSRGINPHLLTMTATPIPRTVCLTLYGELDISIIDEMPEGRKRVKTYLVPLEKRKQAYAWIKKMIKRQNLQVFVVCPLIEESEKESMQAVKAVKKEYDTLKKNVFSKESLGLLHGKMKAKEKDKIMSQFSKGELDILVSTPVVEVGIDVPNANIIIIEGAERFGLAQLHQLRGRVGRCEIQAHCLLFTQQANPSTNKRLRVFSRTHDGFNLAEYDLKNRGAGQIYGTAQHGLADLKIASLTDTQLIRQVSAALKYFIDKKCSLKTNSNLKHQMEKYKHISRD